jgi:CRISPR-associated endonuclease/helicase Cas3
MGRGMTRAERLQDMIWLYLQRGYSDIEMAERLGVDRTTVFRDRAELESEHVFSRDEQGRYRLERMQYMPNIKVNLHEALALYLATRRASRQTRIAQPHTASALEKLAIALKQPMTERLARAAGSILEQSADPERVHVLEVITQGWAEQRKVLITHRALRAKIPKEHIILPYLIEPSLWSDGAYVIGYCESFKKVATFKIERIEKAELKLERFEIPEDFNEVELLRYTWGIWYGENEPVPVRLRFAAGEAARRVKESIWHPTQELQDLEDGGVIWQAQVAEWQEMLPWVRGWGADVEVLEPEELREKVLGDIRAAAEMYGLTRIDNKKVYYAHSNQWDKSRWQRLNKHLENTAKLAVEFGRDAGLSDLAYISALFHDIGKYSLKFQQRLEGKPFKVDHSSAGAQEIKQLFKNDQTETHLATILAYCIAGHHGGLPDLGSDLDVEEDGTLIARLKKDVEDYLYYAQEIDPSKLSLPKRLPIKPIKDLEGFSVAFLTRMLYSILVDADFQETETFMNNGKKPRGGYDGIQTLQQKLTLFLERFQKPDNPIHQQRTDTLETCLAKAIEKPGFFTLTVPTGGGKTLASLAFAMKQAATHDLKRIIYVIPYTSIIEQNAAVFKECLGSENVLEHHSNFDWGRKPLRKEMETADDNTSNSLEKLKLAVENWDIPVVVTTNVQFFESLFSNRSSGCRKLHNIAKSVIIFDEAQMLPREYLKPCMYAVYELVTNYGASAVFCTATQPSVEKFLPPGIELKELSPDPKALYRFYKRVNVNTLGKLPDADLLERVNDHSQVLCIVNTRKHARGLFEGVVDEGRFHLSTLMCPTHRKETIARIKERLANRQSCRVISTQIMEAGIDIDFPVGYRAMPGLESIVQAAGRVNREGKAKIGTLFVFEPVTALIKRIPISIQQGVEFSNRILCNYPDPISIEAIEQYYNDLYGVQSEHAFDVKRILQHFHKGTGELDFDFKTVAEQFRLIEENTESVIIPYDEQAKDILEQARSSDFPGWYARKLQPYTVNIYDREYETIQNQGLIDRYAEMYSVLNNMEFYDAESGLGLPDREGGAAIFFDG